MPLLFGATQEHPWNRKCRDEVEVRSSSVKTLRADIHISPTNSPRVMKFCVASVGVISRTFRKLSSTVKVCKAIFLRFCVIIALLVYIESCNFFPDTLYTFGSTVKMAKNAREYPTGSSRAHAG